LDTAFVSSSTISVGASRGFAAWLRRRRVAVAYAARAAGRVGVVDFGSAGEITSREQEVPGCAALFAMPDRRSLLCASADRILRLAPSSDGTGHAAPEPLQAQTTWRRDAGTARDLALLADGRPILADAGRGLIAVSASGATDTLWHPQAPEAMLTLTGVAVDEDGAAAFATVERERNGRSEGLVIDLASGEVALAGLGRVHAPRLQNGWLWMLEAGRDEVCVAEPGSGLCERVAACPGRASGLVLDGAQALVGISPSPVLRMPLPQGPTRFCGFALIDTHSGTVSEWLDLGEGTLAVDDVALLSTRPHSPARPTD